MKKLLLSIAIVLFVTGANAQWIFDGLNDYYITCFAVSGSNIFVGTNGGVFVSFNNGTDWIAEDSGLSTSVGVASLALSDSNIFAATDSGVFLSTNNGKFWTAVNNGLPAKDFAVSLAISGNNIFAGTEGFGVYLSTNNGHNWTPVNTGLPDSTYVNAMAVNGSNIYVATDDNVYLSTNNGGSWRALGLQEITLSIAISGSDIFVGSDFGTTGGVYLSNDNGAQWTHEGIGLPKSEGIILPDIRALAISGSNIFACGSWGGVYLSTNNGSNWTTMDTSSWPQIIALSLIVVDSTIYAGTTDGVYRQSLQTALGIEQPLTLPATHFTLSPNPTNNSFVIQTNTTTPQLMQLYDITGKLLLAQNISNNKTSIDAGSLAEGMYFVSLKSADGVETEKLVIAK